MEGRAWGSIDTFNDGVVRRASEDDNASYYIVSSKTFNETLIAREKVVALQRTKYLFEPHFDECTWGCKIITTDKVFHTPDYMEDVAYELRVWRRGAV